MYYTRFFRWSSWIARAFLCFFFLTTAVLAQDETSDTKRSQSTPASATGEKAEQKKKNTAKKTEAKADKEKKPQLQLLGRGVTYSAPRRWTKPQASSRGKLEALQFVIPLPSSDSTARVTSAIVVAEPNSDKLSLTDFSNSKLPRKYPAGTVIADQADGDSWRTVVSHVHEANPPYTVVDRFGVAAGLRVHFRIIFPKEDDAKATWLKTLSQESNDFIHSLRINEKTKVAAELFYSNNAWGLREAKARKPSVAKDSTKDAPKTKQDLTKTKTPPVKKATAKSAPKVGEEFAP